MEREEDDIIMDELHYLCRFQAWAIRWMRGRLKDRWAGREENKELGCGQGKFMVPERHTVRVTCRQLDI